MRTVRTKNFNQKIEKNFTREIRDSNNIEGIDTSYKGKKNEDSSKKNNFFKKFKKRNLDRNVVMKTQHTPVKPTNQVLNKSYTSQKNLYSNFEGNSFLNSPQNSKNHQIGENGQKMKNWQNEEKSNFELNSVFKTQKMDQKNPKSEYYTKSTNLNNNNNNTFNTPRTSNNNPITQKQNPKATTEKSKINQFEILDKIRTLNSGNNQLKNPYESQKSSRGMGYSSLSRFKKSKNEENEHKKSTESFNFSNRANPYNTSFSSQNHTQRGKNPSNDPQNTKNLYNNSNSLQAKMGYNSSTSSTSRKNNNFLNKKTEIFDFSAQNNYYREKRKTYQPISAYSTTSNRNIKKDQNSRMKISYLKNILEELKVSLKDIDSELQNLKKNNLKSKSKSEIPLQLIVDEIRDNKEEIRFMNLQYDLLMKENKENKKMLSNAYQRQKMIEREDGGLENCEKEIKKNKDLKKKLRNLEDGFELKLRERASRMEGISEGQLANEVGMLEMRYSNDKKAVFNDIRDYILYLEARNLELGGSNVAKRIGFGRLGF